MSARGNHHDAQEEEEKEIAAAAGKRTYTERTVVDYDEFFRDPFYLGLDGEEDNGNDESLYTQWKRAKRIHRC